MDTSEFHPQYSIDKNEKLIGLAEYAVLMANFSNSHVVILNEELKIPEIFDWRQNFHEMSLRERPGLCRLTQSTRENPFEPFMKLVTELLRTPDRHLFEFPFTFELAGIELKRHPTVGLNRDHVIVGAYTKTDS